MTAIINTPPANIPPVKMNFFFKQEGPTGAVTYDGDTYPYPPLYVGDTRYILYTSIVNTPLVFDAIGQESLLNPHVEPPPGVTVLEYLWNFGDGTEGYGPVVTHTYKVLDPELQVTLTIVDSRNFHYSCSRPVVLVVTAFGALVPYKIRAKASGATSGQVFKPLANLAAAMIPAPWFPPTTILDTLTEEELKVRVLGAQVRNCFLKEVTLNEWTVVGGGTALGAIGKTYVNSEVPAITPLLKSTSPGQKVVAKIVPPILATGEFPVAVNFWINNQQSATSNIKFTVIGSGKSISSGASTPQHWNRDFDALGGFGVAAEATVRAANLANIELRAESEGSGSVRELYEMYVELETEGTKKWRRIGAYNCGLYSFGGTSWESHYSGVQSAAFRYDTEYLNPSLALELAGEGEEEGETLELWSCLSNPENIATINGYVLKIESEFNLQKYRFRLYHYDAGVLTAFSAGVAAQTVVIGDRIGLTVRRGKVTSWRKTGAGNWKIVEIITDSKYTKGYVGIGTKSNLLSAKNLEIG